MSAYLNNENNWWHIARRDAITKLLLHKDRSLKILEIGCGNGSVLLELKKLGFYNLHGTDADANNIEACKQKGLENLSASELQSISLEEGSFDIIIASDVLQLISDDQAALTNWNKLLKVKGEMHVFVPAFKYLWNENDVLNKHVKRYNAFELKTKLESAGLRANDHTYWNFLLYFPTTLYALWSKISSGFKKNNAPKDRFSNIKAGTNNFFIRLLKIENKLFKLFGLPVGLSAYAKGVKVK